MVSMKIVPLGATLSVVGMLIAAQTRFVVKNENRSLKGGGIACPTMILGDCITDGGNNEKDDHDIAKNSSPTRMFDESPVCTAEQNERQAATWCENNAGRHNLVHIFPTIRFHLPAAELVVDVGANKGLVSARWFELWRPELQITAKDYALNHVATYFARKNVTKAGRPCGVTDMCTPPDANMMNALQAFSPVPPHDPAANKLEVHSFEPSAHLHDMHVKLQTNASFLNQLSEQNSSRSATWKWHKIAASDYDGDVYFTSSWNEGSQIKANAKQEPNTRSARLDTLVYQDGFFGGSGDNAKIIDVLKIDAESVDLKVVAGSTQLLLDQRIRVIMWETPNAFPVTFPDNFGGPVQSFGEAIHRMDVYAGMTCYFPANNNKNIKITGCWDALKAGPPCKKGCPYQKGCRADHGNALCVSRILAPALYQAMEAQALVY